MTVHAAVTAHCDTPIVGLVPILDGPLAWAWWQLQAAAGAELPPITAEDCADADLPLARWEEAGMWGWRVSAPISDSALHTATEIRRRPPTTAMARYTRDREHHAGLGPTKARSVTLAATWHPTITWHAEVTDRDAVESLLAVITHLGGRHRNGFGHVARWTVDEGPVDGWRQRPPVTPGVAVRAPYWHPSRRAC